MPILHTIEKRLIKRLSKGFHKQPWLIVLLIVFMAMMKRNHQRKNELEKDKNYWRTIGGL